MVIIYKFHSVYFAITQLGTRLRWYRCGQLTCSQFKFVTAQQQPPGGMEVKVMQFPLVPLRATARRTRNVLLHNGMEIVRETLPKKQEAKT